MAPVGVECLGACFDTRSFEYQPTEALGDHSALRRI